MEAAFAPSMSTLGDSSVEGAQAKPSSKPASMSALVGALHRASRDERAQQEEQTDQLRRSKVYFNSAGKNSIFISPKMREALKGKAAKAHDALLAVSEKNDPKKAVAAAFAGAPDPPVQRRLRASRGDPTEDALRELDLWTSREAGTWQHLPKRRQLYNSPRGLWCLKFQPPSPKRPGSPDPRRATSRVHADIAAARATMREKLEASGYGTVRGKIFSTAGGEAGTGTARAHDDESPAVRRGAVDARRTAPHVDRALSNRMKKLQHSLVVQEGHEERNRRARTGVIDPLARGMAADGYWGALRQASEKSDAARRLGTNSQLGSLSAEPLPATWRDNAFLHAGARKQQQELLELLAARRDVEKYEAVRRPRTG